MFVLYSFFDYIFVCGLFDITSSNCCISLQSLEGYSRKERHSGAGEKVFHRRVQKAGEPATESIPGRATVRSFPSGPEAWRRRLHQCEPGQGRSGGERNCLPLQNNVLYGTASNRLLCPFRWNVPGGSISCARDRSRTRSGTSG